MCEDIHKNSLDEDNRRFVLDEVFETVEEAEETVEWLIGAYKSEEENMLIETKRLVIRDLKTEDELPFVEMAVDGSLNDVGFDKDCGQWMSEWITEARDLAIKDNPCLEYLAYVVTLKDKNIVVGSVGCSFYEDLREIGITYFIGAQYRDNGYALEAVKAYTEYFFNHYDVSRIIATIREENVASWRVVEKAGFQLTDKKMYKDLNDEKSEMYLFYEFKR